MTKTSSGAKAGLMVRNSLAADSAFVSLFATPGANLRAQSRALAKNTIITNASFETSNSAIVTA
jgi:hypothetical protein